MKIKSKNILEYRKTAGRPLILDGAVGSLLQQEGFNDSNLWTSKANLSDFNKVKSIHQSYILAGAEIITTNTFRTNPLAFKQSSIKMNYYNFIDESVSAAYEANDNGKVFIAASNSPAEDCYQVERKLSNQNIKENHEEHIQALWETNKVDFILNETFGHFDEILIVCEFCKKENIPFVISLFSIDGISILSGENNYDVVKEVQKYSPLAISFNCVYPEIYKIIDFNIDSDYSNGFYLNCGSGELTDSEIQCGIEPESYLNLITPFVKEKTLFVGSCCGSNPNHTKILRNYFDTKN